MKYLQKKTNQKSIIHVELLQEVLGRTNRLLSFDTKRTAYKTMRPTILLSLRRRCHGEVVTEPLPSNDRGMPDSCNRMI
jgi:hypothetical protein